MIYELRGNVRRRIECEVEKQAIEKFLKNRDAEKSFEEKDQERRAERQAVGFLKERRLRKLARRD